MGNEDDHQLLSLASHELRAPVAVVAGYVRLLLKGEAGQLSRSQRKLIEALNTSCARILTLTREISDLAVLQRADLTAGFQPLPIFPLCDEVVRTTADTHDRRIVFTCEAADRPALVNGDAGRLRNAFASFIAAEHRERGAEDLEAHGFVHRADGQTCAVVVLGSQGVAARRAVVFVEAAAFERWRGGMGMVLPIACHVIEAHGGRVWALQGATVIALPALTPSVL